MTAFCTYCSAEKSDSESPLPASERYRSERIRAIQAAARSAGLPFFVLSGKFGLVEPHDPLPFYDHLLKHQEVSRLAATVAEQLRAQGIDQVIFFARPASEDRNVEPYVDCATSAARKAGVTIMVVEFSQ